MKRVSLFLVVIVLFALGSRGSAQNNILNDTDITGIYKGRHCSKSPDEVRILALGHQRVKVQIDACCGEPDGYGGGVHCGTAIGIGTIVNNVVVIVVDTVDPDISPLGCSFTLTFRAGHRLYVKHNGGAGSFGDVDGSGLYRRVKKGKPTFDE